ncbi:MAG: hypothetical protein U0797_19565 [Gemmataceae bacterium]
MFDEVERLREAADLHALLTHYADLAAVDRQAWQDRRLRLDGCGRRGRPGCTGELIAHGWIEQNTRRAGAAARRGPGLLPCRGRAAGN